MGKVSMSFHCFSFIIRGSLSPARVEEAQQRQNGSVINHPKFLGLFVSNCVYFYSKPPSTFFCCFYILFIFSYKCRGMGMGATRRCPEGEFHSQGWCIFFFFGLFQYPSPFLPSQQCYFLLSCLFVLSAVALFYPQETHPWQILTTADTEATQN